MASDPRAVVIRAYLEWLRTLPPGRSRGLPADLSRALALHPGARAEAEAMHASERTVAVAAPPTKREPAVFRPMADAERTLALCLVGCAFSVGSFDKRFVLRVAGLARASEPRITDKQAALLPKLAHRYRRQLGGCPVDGCAECAAKESDHG